MKLFIIFTTIANMLFAETTIHLNQEQLQQTQREIIRQGKQAIQVMPQTQQQLAQLHLPTINNIQIPNLHNIKPLTTQLPNGDKYYLFSESIATATENNTLDINQTISDYNRMTKNSKDVLSAQSLLIFISSSMPKKTILNLMHQASPISATFVVRGLIDNSYVKTYKYFYSLKGDNNIAIMINPTMFKAFGISAVPTFAVYSSTQNLMQTACSIEPNYTKVTGDVSINYALNQLKTSIHAKLSQLASNQLYALENSDFYTGDKS